MPNAPQNRKAPPISTASAIASLMRSTDVLALDDDPSSARSSDLPGILAQHRLHALVTARADALAPYFADLEVGGLLLETLSAAKRSTRLLALRDAILERGLADALQILERAGIQPIILKGRALAITLYDDPCHRPHSDVDLLIHPDDARTVRGILSDAGFDLPHGIRGQFTSHQFLYSRKLSAGVELHLDIHWKLSNRHQFAHAITYNEARSAAHTLYRHGVPHRVIGFEHALLHALIHLYAHHHDDFQPAIWLYDIYLLIQQLSDEQLLNVLHRAESACASSVVKRGMTRASLACGADLSKPVRAALNALPDDTSEAFFDMSRLDEIQSDLRVIHSPASRARYLAEVAFPPASSTLERYGYESKLMLPIAYARRAIEFLG